MVLLDFLILVVGLPVDLLNLATWLERSWEPCLPFHSWSISSTYSHLQKHWLMIAICLCKSISIDLLHTYVYTPLQRGNYHHSMFHIPTAAVNLFHVGKQYLTLCKAKAAVTHNLIGRKIISNVKHADARNSLPILDVICSSHKRHSASEYCK